MRPNCGASVGGDISNASCFLLCTGAEARSIGRDAFAVFVFVGGGIASWDALGMERSLTIFAVEASFAVDALLVFLTPSLKGTGAWSAL